MKSNENINLLNNLRRCNRLLIEFKKSYVIIVILLAIIQGLLPAATLTLRKNIINNIQVRTLNISEFLVLVLIYVGIAIVSLVIDYIYGIYNATVSANFNNYIKLMVLNKATQLNLKNFEDSQTFNIIDRAKTQSGGNILSFYSSFMSIIKSIIKIITTIIIISEFSIYLIPLVMILPVLRYWYYLKFNKLRYDFQIRRTVDNRILWYIEYLLLTGNAFKEIKLLNISDYLIKNYKFRALDIIRENLNIIKQTGKINTTISIADQFLTGGILTYILFMGFNGRLLIGEVITYNDGLITVKQEIENALLLISGMAENALNLNFLFDFLNLNSDILEEVENNTESIKIGKVERISLKNVSYSYQGSNLCILKNINLNISSNKTIGLVGKNGAGKSTLIKILMGFYDDYEGDIFINDINLKLIDKESYMNKIRCVFQDYIRFEMSIRENIGFGNIINLHNDNDITKCLAGVGLDEKLYSEGGLDTIIGSWFGSKDISIGEWQRIAISRAIFRNADIYIFDEPDASLDGEVEFKMIKTYKKILSGRVGIFISHKVNHIKFVADEIVVINNNTIEETGTHEELMRKKGTYYDLYNAQNI
ncbi:MAG: ABC transporter ATP-binding protein [Bacteroidia bacterium]|nr:ABC transporter ATP-binding protein [Bacteroidia bacterium]